MHRAYLEIIDFILKGKTLEEVAEFQASQAAKDRVFDLIEREKNEGITPEETQELDTYMQLEHLMRLTKARARAMLARG